MKNAKKAIINKKFVENVQWLAKEKGIKLGKLEKNADVSVGYLARHKDEQSILLSVALSMAQTLGTDIETIVNLNPRIIERQRKLEELDKTIAALEEERKNIKGDM